MVLQPVRRQDYECVCSKRKGETHAHIHFRNINRASLCPWQTSSLKLVTSEDTHPSASYVSHTHTNTQTINNRSAYFSFCSAYLKIHQRTKDDGAPIKGGDVGRVKAGRPHPSIWGHDTPTPPHIACGVYVGVRVDSVKSLVIWSCAGRWICNTEMSKIRVNFFNNL